MKKRIIGIGVFFSIIMILITCIFYIQDNKQNLSDIIGSQIVALNEIKQFALKGDYEKLIEKSSNLEKSLRSSQYIPDNTLAGISKNNRRLLFLCSIYIIFITVILGYIYFAILRPFDKMKNFAIEIAKGNFNIPLNYERANYFGSFTWAFDSMRREIVKARTSEKEAIENNKTVIATLSHDIKTPVSSIRAYAEGLEANLDNSPYKRAKYLGILMKKCDEVSKLVNDLFLHSISDLDKLKIIEEKIEILSFMENAVLEILEGHSDINFTKPDTKIFVMADRNRLLQICENLINNSRKYAKTNIDVNIDIDKETNNIQIHFRDYGNGIPDDDMPFIFDKFYRGKNCGNEQGSGLGLYIVKYITDKMGGNIMLNNHLNGLEAVVCLPIVSFSTNI